MLHAPVFFLFFFRHLPEQLAVLVVVLKGMLYIRVVGRIYAAAVRLGSERNVHALLVF